MSDEGFSELEKSLNQALAHTRGEKGEYKEKKLVAQPPPKSRSSVNIVRLRHRRNCSQAMFARMLNVSTKTVQALEQGTRKPSDAALKLLAVAEKHTETLLDSV
ncbi:MAG: helix-turn-helix domain-containing protein [Blastocatellia bacterium]